MDIKYNSQNKIYKTPFGAVPCGTAVTFSVCSNVADKIVLHGFDKAYEMIKFDGLFSCTLTSPDTPEIVQYYFEVFADSLKLFAIPKSGKGGECILNSEITGKYQLTVYKNSPTPDWFKGAVMYQIYVDRFFRPANNPALKENILFHSSWNDKPLYIYDNQNRIVQWDFFGGNLRGVIEKLDYIKSLGVDVIYFNPIFESSSNHKYDTADYSKVDTMYGNEDVLKELIQKAKKMDMHIILDGVFSHTGDDSIYFNKYGKYNNPGAYQGEESPYYSWFKFNKFPDDYKSWWGIDALPEINKDNPSYRDFLFNQQDGIIKKWMDLGIMGWRLDVADELPDDFIKEMKQSIKSCCNAPILLGEVWEDASNKISYGEKRKYIIDDSLDSVSNYPLRDSIINYLLCKSSGEKLLKLIMSLQENYPKDVFGSLMNLSGTHDSTRLATLLGEAPENDSLDLWDKREYVLDDKSYAIAIKRINLFFLILFTLPGNPCIYYGDETAMQGYKDPYNRGTFPWDSTRDNLRGLIIELSHMRNNNHAFKFGFFDYEVINDDILCYSLSDNESKYKIYINRSNILEHMVNTPYTEILLNLNTEIKEETISLQPFSGFIIKVD